MKKRSLLAILMVTIGLFISSSLISQDNTANEGNSPNQQVEGQHVGSGDVVGVFVPD